VDLRALFNQHFQNGNALGIAQLGHPHFDAHSSAFTSLRVLLRNTTKRAASAPSMTR